jgi:hypothetical protein
MEIPLRRGLGEDPAEPRLLHTLPGVGIMLKAGPRWCPTPPSL